jgi:putative flippase GtrA
MIPETPTSRPDAGIPSPPGAEAPKPAGGTATVTPGHAATAAPRCAATEAQGDTAGGGTGRLARLRRSPLLRRITGYSAGSVIAAFTSELAFAGAFGWLHSGTTWASGAGFVGGAIPNYILNRRWAWQGRNGRSRRSEITLYACVSIASFLVSAVVTDVAERWARQLTASSNIRVILVAASYLAVSGVFFIGKFVAYELIVFTKGPAPEAGSSSPSAEPSTTS